MGPRGTGVGVRHHVKGGGSKRGGEADDEAAGRGGKGVTAGQGERRIYRPASTPTRSHRLANRNGGEQPSVTSWWAAGQARRFHNTFLSPARGEQRKLACLAPRPPSAEGYERDPVLQPPPPPSPHATFLAFPRTTSIRTPRTQQIGIKNSTPIQRGKSGSPPGGEDPYSE